jgi:hypothetical protein
MAFKEWMFYTSLMTSGNEFEGTAWVEILQRLSSKFHADFRDGHYSTETSVGSIISFQMSFHFSPSVNVTTICEIVNQLKILRQTYRRHHPSTFSPPVGVVQGIHDRYGTIPLVDLSPRITIFNAEVQTYYSMVVEDVDSNNVGLGTQDTYLR